MSFTLTHLAGDQVLVEGTDVRGTTGQEILHGRQWAAIQQRTNVTSAIEKVDEAIETLLAPIMEAAEEVQAAMRPAKIDPLFVIVEREGTEHVAGQTEIVTRLDRDSVIIRAVEEGNTDRLLWVNGSLVVTAAPAQDETFEIPDFED